MLRQTIQDQLKQSMKDKDQVTLDSLRFVWAQIKNAEIDKKSDLTDQEITALLKKEVKLRKEAIEEFKKAGREETVTEEEAKLKVITNLLPEEMSQQEVEKIVSQVMSSGQKDFGAIMGQVMAKTKGQADGKVVSSIVKQKLESG